MKSYRDYLEEQLTGIIDVGCLKYLPDIFKLLCDLLEEPAVGKDARNIINMALAYFVNPADVLDEEIYGYKGYHDDMYVACFALRRIESDYISYMKQHMPNYSDIIAFCYNESERFLDERKIRFDVLAFSGLVEKGTRIE